MDRPKVNCFEQLPCKRLGKLRPPFNRLTVKLSNVNCSVQTFSKAQVMYTSIILVSPFILSRTLLSHSHYATRPIMLVDNIMLC